MLGMMMGLAMAGPASDESATEGGSGPDRIVVIGTPLPGSPPGWVAVLGDCLEERRPGAFQVLDRREPSTPWMDQLERVDEHNAALVVVALPSDPGAGLDRAALRAVLERRAEDAQRTWLLFALPIRPEQRSPVYQELSAMVARRSETRILDPWKNAPLSQISTGTPPWLSEAGVTPAGETRVASLACNAVLPRTP